MWKSNVGPWVGFTSTEGWGLELENWRFQSCVRPMGTTIVFQRRQTTYPRSHTTKWNKTRARKRLAWCPVGRAPLFLSQSPSELRLTKDFTPKEARSFSDPLIPTPSHKLNRVSAAGGQVNLPILQDYGVLPPASMAGELTAIQGKQEGLQT